MGFSDYFIQTIISEPGKKPNPDASAAAEDAASNQKSDQEILESIEDIYYQPETNAQMYELEVSVCGMTAIGCLQHQSSSAQLCKTVVVPKGKVSKCCKIMTYTVACKHYENRF